MNQWNSEEKGLAMEKNLESQGPGTFSYVFCDLNMEEHIKVNCFQF